MIPAMQKWAARKSVVENSDLIALTVAGILIGIELGIALMYFAHL